MAVLPRSRNDAALASLKKYPSDFFNHACGLNEPKKASFTGTGVTRENQQQQITSIPDYSTV